MGNSPEGTEYDEKQDEVHGCEIFLGLGCFLVSKL